MAIDGDHVAWDPAMSRSMHGDHCVRIGSVREAERSLAVVVEPVGQIADAVLVLDRDVLDVGSRQILGAGAREIVAVEEEGHGRSMGQRVECRQPGSPIDVERSPREH
ncbi:MAG TPA: hypothetical protein VD763_00615 [Candidatus Saccharimonadales bacterium]|nr:hypothetical protein [Candidatus Saccharimonadales bacterium]